MNKRINVVALLLVFALLLCEINLTVTDASYKLQSGVISGGGEVQEQTLSPVEDTAFVEFDTPESISGQSNGALFSVRSQARGRAFQRAGVRLLLLFISILCFLQIAVRYLRFRLILPEDAIASSIILFFIHRQDGKK